MQQVAGQVAALDLGYKPNLNVHTPKVLYLLGADNETVTKNKPSGTTVIYQGKNILLGWFLNEILVIFFNRKNKMKITIKKITVLQIKLIVIYAIKD